jgi:CubicO group peptidase (beta-lactamase class C family)
VWTPIGGASGHVTPSGTSAFGAHASVFAWASVTKLFTAYACLIAVEEGSVGVDDPIDGFPGVTLAHLLSHSAGIASEQPVSTFPPATRRLYSNAGIRLAAQHVEQQTNIAFTDYVRSGVLDPLRLAGVQFGDPATGASGSLDELLRFAQELLRPQLIAPVTLAWATQPWFPELEGVVPGFGLQRPCPWGLGFELKGAKSPHWTGSSNSAQTFGHFGQSGSLLAVDPIRQQAWCSLSPEPFGAWARGAWPDMIDETG